MRRAALLLGAVLAAVVSAAAAAAPADEIVGVSDRVLQLETSKGVLLRLARPAGTVFVADPKIADIQVKSPRLIYVFGKRPGETTLYAVDADERVLASRPVRVSHNLSRLRATLKALVPGARLEVRSVDDSLVVSGTVATAAAAADVRRLARRVAGDADRLVLRLAVNAPNQVHLRVRVAEVSRTVLKQFGINWDAVFSSSNFVFGLATGNPVVAAGSFLTRSGNTNSLFGGFRNGKFDINGLIDALDDEGLITVLAEPSLTAVSGQTATFLAGGEFPILVPENDQVTVEFKQFGVSLAFTPTIVGKDRISLKVAPEVSQLSNTGAVQISGFTIPALTTRRAETTVELGGGQSFAIAGLLQNDVTRNLDEFPGLGDVPVLGALFRSDRFQRNETELVIIVTPYVVRPVSATRLAAPTDGLVPPSDAERVLQGRIYRPALARGPGGPRGPGGDTLAGPAGFVLD